MKVDNRGYVYLGKEFSGQEFSLVVEEGGFILRLEKTVRIPAQHAWFFDPDWQEGEKRAQEDIDKGKTKKFSDAKNLIDEIDSRQKNKKK